MYLYIYIERERDVGTYVFIYCTQYIIYKYKSLSTVAESFLSTVGVVVSL